MAGEGINSLACSMSKIKEREMNDQDKQKLYETCKSFVDEQNIYCSESIYQTDRVMENAYDLIEKLCDIVGYKQDPSDEGSETN